MRWYRAKGRHSLPWRQTRDPYAVLVSEVMLQQTQVERVLPYFATWMARWPGFEALASEPASEVIRAWRGLGYNRRALNLHRLAAEVVSNYAGRLPDDAHALRRLPGIGPYTAAAVQCFARGERIVVADTNIARVVSRTCLGAASQRSIPARDLSDALSHLLPVRGARTHNLALMDFGALVCTARSPGCDICPLSRLCAWNLAGKPGEIAPQPATPRFETTARFARGRIIDALREFPAPTAGLAAILPHPHATRVEHYLEALEREGLVERNDDWWRLPG